MTTTASRCSLRRSLSSPVDLPDRLPAPMDLSDARLALASRTRRAGSDHVSKPPLPMPRDLTTLAGIELDTEPFQVQSGRLTQRQVSRQRSVKQMDALVVDDAQGQQIPVRLRDLNPSIHGPEDTQRGTTSNTSAGDHMRTSTQASERSWLQRALRRLEPCKTMQDRASDGVRSAPFELPEHHAEHARPASQAPDQGECGLLYIMNIMGQGVGLHGLTPPVPFGLVLQRDGGHTHGVFVGRPLKRTDTRYENSCCGRGIRNCYVFGRGSTEETSDGGRAVARGCGRGAASTSGARRGNGRRVLAGGLEDDLRVV